jgi:hypothetical protein
MDLAKAISFSEPHSHAVAVRLLDYVEGELFFLSSGDRPPHSLVVIGIDAGVEACSGDRDITHTGVDQLGAASRIDVDQNALYGRALGGVRS